MEGIALETLGAGGAVAVLVVGLIAWKLFKLALKVVILLVLGAALAVGAALQSGGALPVGDLPPANSPR